MVDIVPYTVTNTGDGNLNFNTVTFEVTPTFDYTDPAGILLARLPTSRSRGDP